MFATMRCAMRRVLVLLALTLAMGALVAGRVAAEAPRGTRSPMAEKLFSRGLEAYRDGKDEDAARHFQKLLEFPVNQRTSAASLLLARTQYRLGRYPEALETAKALERRFSDSRYVPYARMLAGDCYLVLKRYYEAANQYGRLLATPSPLPVQAQAAERLAATAGNGLISTAALGRVRAAVGAQRLREALLYGRSRWYGRLGWEAQSQMAMRAYLDSIPDGIFARFAGGQLGDEAVPGSAAAAIGVPVDQPPARHERIRRATDGPRLGLLLPLSGSGFQRQVGDDLHAGVQLANEAAGEPFELVVADIGTDYGDLPIVETESSRLIRVIQQAERLIYEEGVVAIIGPVFSSDCVAAAVVAEQAGVPLLAPLAQQSGLAGLGDNVFQLNTIPEIQAHELAEYATLVLGVQTLAVISPLTDYGWSFEREFRRVALDNGGQVVHVDWYVPDESKDFRRIFEEIRQVGFSLMPPPVAEDTVAVDDGLALAADDTTLLGPEPSFLTELLAGLEEPVPEMVEDEEEAPTDSTEIFIDTIDAIVIVVEQFADAQTIVPQLHYHRLLTQILGNDIWYEPEAIRQMRPADREYIEGAILVSRYLEEGKATRAFIDAFRRRFARDPGYAAFGHDAAGVLLAVWAQGSHTPEQLRDALTNLRSFSGASGNISFSPERRTNGELELLKIDRRGILRRVLERDLPPLTGLSQEAMAEGEGADLPIESLLPEDVGPPE
jgi:ABC-type branched-subunit amino acid transport system substrate-binding protein